MIYFALAAIYYLHKQDFTKNANKSYIKHTVISDCALS